MSLDNMGIGDRVRLERAGAMAANLQLAGNWRLVHRDPMGELINMAEGRNLVVTTGAEEIAHIIETNTGPTRPTHMEVGDSSTAPAAGQTDIQGTGIGARQPFSSVVRTGNAIAYERVFAAGESTGTWEEIGIFNDVSAGDMIARFLTGTQTKGAGDSITVTWTLTFQPA